MSEKITGGLSLTLHDGNFIQIGEIKIYLQDIKVFGSGGGKKAAIIKIVAPKTIDIARFNR